MILFIIVRKIQGRIHGQFKNCVARLRDYNTTTFINSNLKYLHSYFKMPEYEILGKTKCWILAASNHYLSHRFDILGSGWCSWNIAEKNNNAVNTKNKSNSGRINNLISEDYRSINWHTDIKCGFQWRRKKWYKDIKPSPNPGVDIKIPWELSRMHHLVHLAWAYAFANGGEENFQKPTVYSCEFHNQILDFIASNPPRFGPNWTCTMDVGIRAANWLVAYDLFVQMGTTFDATFIKEFTDSIYTHGKHIVNNLEWSKTLRNNHYLSNIVCLIFVAAYLPASAESNAWLSFGARELINEVKYQFNEDGSSFEGSTSYHRLSAELVVYATALILAVDDEKRVAIFETDENEIAIYVPMAIELKNNLHLVMEPLFPDWYFTVINKMALFTKACTFPDGCVVQIGDNDSGRFLKIDPAYVEIQNNLAGKKFITLKQFHDKIKDDIFLYEESLNHRHIISEIKGLFGIGSNNQETLDYEIIKGMLSKKGSYDCVKSDLRKKAEQTFYIQKSKIGSDQIVKKFHKFGLYIYECPRYSVAIRCGELGQKGVGGHDHNDQLSFVMAIDGKTFLIDSGTYLYTSSVADRNKFRSTPAHNVLYKKQKEQGGWRKGQKGLFRMNRNGSGTVSECSQDCFIGTHSFYGIPYQRKFVFYKDRISVEDQLNDSALKKIAFHLAPNVLILPKPVGNEISLSIDKVNCRLISPIDHFEIYPTVVSPDYGVLSENKTIELHSTLTNIKWDILIESIT